MRNFIKLLLALILSCHLSIASLAQRINILQGTPIEIVFPYAVDGGNINEGSSVVIEISEDFVQNGRTIFKSGDKGTVTVDEGEGKKFLIGGGHIKAINGQKVKVSLNKQAKGKTLVGSVPFWIGLFLFWPALFFIKTKDAMIPAGSTAQAFLMQDEVIDL